MSNNEQNLDQKNNMDEMETLKAKNEELLNNWKRTAADFENYRKRKEQEGSEMMQFAKEMAVMNLLPSMQSLEQVLKYAPDDEKYKDWVAGLKATILQLEKSMEELGVRKIKTVGEKFDPSLHEAVEETDGDSGVVVKEIQPGFSLNGKVIIPAKVGVGK
jgi:molecular chaperone GrpE